MIYGQVLRDWPDISAAAGLLASRGQRLAERLRAMAVEIETFMKRVSH
jgi:hypothetical protein